MKRTNFLFASITGSVAILFGSLLSGCGQKSNEFVGTWEKQSEVDPSTVASMIIDGSTVTPVDSQGKSTTTLPYKVVSDNEAVATGMFGMSVKLQLVDHNTLRTSSPDCTFTRA